MLSASSSSARVSHLDLRRWIVNRWGYSELYCYTGDPLGGQLDLFFLFLLCPERKFADKYAYVSCQNLTEKKLTSL